MIVRTVMPVSPSGPPITNFDERSDVPDSVFVHPASGRVLRYRARTELKGSEDVSHRRNVGGKASICVTPTGLTFSYFKVTLLFASGRESVSSPDLRALGEVFEDLVGVVDRRRQ